MAGTAHHSEVGISLQRDQVHSRRILVAAAMTRGVVLFVAQVMGQLGVHRPLHQPPWLVVSAVLARRSALPDLCTRLATCRLALCPFPSVPLRCRGLTFTQKSKHSRVFNQKSCHVTFVTSPYRESSDTCISAASNRPRRSGRSST